MAIVLAALFHRCSSLPRAFFMRPEADVMECLVDTKPSNFLTRHHLIQHACDTGPRGVVVCKGDAHRSQLRGVLPDQTSSGARHGPRAACRYHSDREGLLRYAREKRPCRRRRQP